MCWGQRTTGGPHVSPPTMAPEDWTGVIKTELTWAARLGQRVLLPVEPSHRYSW